jgi:hypothetical protein
VSRIRTIPHASWSDAASPDIAEFLSAALECGQVVFLPNLPFVVDRQDAGIFSPAILSSSKNTSFDPASGMVGGTTLAGGDLARLRALMARFSDSTRSLVDRLFPRYRGSVQRARASFRPAEIAGRQTSWRKDDSRLHIDSFPATPVQGRRILRVFSNVNPSGRPRSWRVGGAFETVAGRFGPALVLPRPGSAAILRLLRVTKTRRTPYDALMLQLHDRMKEDAAFQETCEQEAFDFPAGSTWIAFTDAVSHAATSGQYQLEQTFLLPIDAMEDESRSPLRILERLKGRALV